jgi:hypothetical protein
MSSDPVVINDSQNNERVRIGEIVEPLQTGKAGVEAAAHPDWWGMVVKNPKGDHVVEIGRGTVSAPLGEAGGTAGTPTATAAFGGGGLDGHLQLRTADGRTVLEAKIGPITEAPGAFLSSEPIEVDVGGALAPGTISAIGAVDGSVVQMRSAPPGIDVARAHKTKIRIEGDGSVWLGGNGAGSDIYLFDQLGDNATAAQATLHIRGASPGIGMTVAGKPTVRLGGPTADIWLGGNGPDGKIFLFNGQKGDNLTQAKATIVIDGGAGDITLQNADCAEEFELSDDGVEAEPGTVLAIGADGRLRASAQAYDRRVAGVVSGAGALRPAITLGHDRSASGGRAPVALVGRVFCKVDASEGPIEVGDLLTTADRTGYAMKASDPLRAFGAVLGKALEPHGSATGLIPILVTLQ